MKRAIYPGSFDPVTYGHIEIIKRASEIFDELIVGVLENRAKTPLFSIDERVNILNEVLTDLDNVTVKSYDGLLVDFTVQENAGVIVRGLRAVTDFDYELQLAQIYASYPDVPCETVYLMTDPRYSFISSTIVRENFSLGADVSNLVSNKVYDLMLKFNK